MLRRLTVVDRHLKEILAGSAAAISVKLTAAASAFAMNVLIARALGAADAGLYFLAYTIAYLAAVAGRLGLDNTLVRFIAADHARGNWPAINGLYRRALTWATTASAVMAFTLWALSEQIAVQAFNKSDLAPVLGAIALSIVPMTWYALHAHALQGLRRVGLSAFTLGLAFPMVFTLFLLCLMPCDARSAAPLAVAAALCAAAIGRALWTAGRRAPGEIAHVDRKEILASCVPLLLVAVMSEIVAWSSQLFLGIWASSTDVAVFSVAQRTAMLTTFILIGVNSIAAPKFAAMYQQKQMKQLRRTARQATHLSTLVAIGPLTLLLAFRTEILGLFGAEFYAGSEALVILAIGQFVNVATGPVGFILMMTGREAVLRNNTVAGAATAVALGYLLVPELGLRGAAISTATAVVLQNLLCLWRVNRLFRDHVKGKPIAERAGEKNG